MECYIRKLTRQGNYYRINLPKALIVKAGLLDCPIVTLSVSSSGIIQVAGYHGSEEDKDTVPGTNSKSD